MSQHAARVVTIIHTLFATMFSYLSNLPNGRPCQSEAKKRIPGLGVLERMHEPQKSGCMTE